MPTEKRPPFSEIHTAPEFDRWYWLKTELVTICRELNLSTAGNKATLRQRILHALAPDQYPAPTPTKRAPRRASFSWSKAALRPDTVIDASVSFGPNFRHFMRSQIGEQFSCHSDFMDWVRANVGKTLADAVIAWQQLELRKADPNFRRDIAEHNQMLRYLRAFLDDQPTADRALAMRCWELKKQRPAPGGRILYHPSDLDLL